MNYTLLIPGVGVVCFVAGIVFSKAMLSEAETIKQHVTTEVAATEARLRADFNALLEKVKARL